MSKEEAKPSAYSSQHTQDMPIDEAKLTDKRIFDAVEKRPEFQGGDNALMSFIAKNLKYPVEAHDKGIQGKVILRFVVASSGKTTNIEVLKSIYPALDNEAIRVIESLPDWIPGMQNGVKVNVHYILPVSFKLTNSTGDNHNNVDKPILIKILPPRFPSGTEALNNFVQKNIQYPDDAKQAGIQGKVLVQFEVNAEGKVENPQIVHSVSASLDKEALRIVKLLPDFIPGTRNGVNSTTNYALQIPFKLE
jgi:TonB family protein